MNNVIFKKIILDSFLSYDHEELEISQAGVTFIKGENNQDSKSESNGSGKSALISESLIWCLTGYTSRNADEVKNLYLDRGASVSVYLEKNGVDYVIIRGTHGSLHPNGLSVYKNGENLTKARLSDTKEWFETEFPELTWSVLTSIVILSQGLVGGLSNLVNRDRKAKLEELSKVNYTYNLVKSLAESVQTRFETKMKSVVNRELEADIKIKANLKMIDSLKSTILAIEERNSKTVDSSFIEESISRLSKEKSDLEVRKKELEQAISIEETKYNFTKDELDQVKNQYNRRVKEFDSISYKVNGIESEIKAKLSFIEKTEHSLSHVLDKECPTCHQTVDTDFTENYKLKLSSEIEEAKQSIKNLEELLNKDKSDLAALSLIIVTFEKQIATTEQNLNGSKAILENNKTLLRNTNDLINLNNTNIFNLYNMKNKPTESTESYQVKISEINEEIKNIELENISILREKVQVESWLNTAKWFASQSSKSLRSFMLEGVIDFINTRSKEYSEYLFDSDEVILKSEGSSLDIFLGNRKIENCSGGERRRVDIVIQLAIRDLVMTETGFSSNLLIIDEVFDHLDSLGMSTVLDLITSQKQVIDSIFLITHKSDADIDYDQMMIVRKENNISRVVKWISW